ncbi:MAG: alpha/beta fold hydrolase [Candidatus Sumerlaeaceae bacterium]|nr:alpha/beta fold hydrolase [Candidatus Sumerlaeaceae bacterium]
MIRRFLLAVVVMGKIAAAAVPGPGDHATTFTSSTDQTSQPYRLYVPRAAVQTSSTLPLLVVLHGRGVDQNAWFDFTPVKTIAERYGYVVAAPLGRGNWWYRLSAEQDVLDVVADVQRRLPVDPDRTYLAGHSMGGWGTWRIAMRHPDVFAAISPMSGFAPFELLPAARHLNPFIIHDRDDEIVAVDRSRQPVMVLTSLGLSSRYREEQGYGHASSLIGDNLPRVLEWFNDCRRVRNPRIVSFATRTPRVGKAYWLRILATVRFPDIGEITAEQETSGALKITTRNVARFAVKVSDLPRVTTGTLEARCDDVRLRIPARTEWAVFSNPNQDKKWKVESAKNEPDPDPAKEFTGRFASSARGATSQTVLAGIVATALLDQAKVKGAKACLLDEENQRVAVGAFTEDSVLDMHVYPDQELVVTMVYSADVKKVAKTKGLGRVGLYPDPTLPPEGKRIKVLAPINLARIVADKNDQKLGEVLPLSIPEYLLKAAREK